MYLSYPIMFIIKAANVFTYHKVHSTPNSITHTY